MLEVTTGQNYTQTKPASAFTLPIKMCSKWFHNSFDKQILDLVITES